MYVVKTTDALVLFFKQRNLQKENRTGKVKNKRERNFTCRKKRKATHSTISTLFVHGSLLRLTCTNAQLWQLFGNQLRKGKIATKLHGGVSRLQGELTLNINRMSLTKI